jgi:hypothetical protein
MEAFREHVLADLRGAFPEVEVDEWGSVVVLFRDFPVHCKFSRAADGEPVVLVQAPVLLDVHAPPDDLYELVCLLQSRIVFGSLAVIGSSSGNIHLMLNAHLLETAAATAKRAVRLVHEEARVQAHCPARTPPNGGVTAAGS